MSEPVEAAKAIGAPRVPVLAFCGESLLIESIEASLKGRGGVEIVRLDTSRPEALQALDKLSPDIIVFDLTQGQLSCVVAYLRTHTDVVLIGLDIEHDLALYLSGGWRVLQTVADLMQAIEASIQVENEATVRQEDSALKLKTISRYVDIDARNDRFPS